jgi:hypothetical protein
VPDPSTVDPLAEVLAGLRSSPVALAVFGTASAFSGLAEPPYPHVAVVPSAAGDDRDGRWARAPEIQLETYGAPDGTPGQAEVYRLHYVALGVVLGLPDRNYAPVATVLSRISPLGTAQWAPLALGQPMWRSVLTVVCHPALA